MNVVSAFIESIISSSAQTFQCYLVLVPVMVVGLNCHTHHTYYCGEINSCGVHVDDEWFVKIVAFSGGFVSCREVGMCYLYLLLYIGG